MVSLALIAFPLVLWVALYFALPHVAISWDLDFGNPLEPKSFLYLYDRYCIVFRHLMWLSALASAVTWKEQCFVASRFFSATTVCAFLFQGGLLWFYELYLQTKYKPVINYPPYPTGGYALTISLAASTVIYFVAGTICAAAWR